MTVDEGAHDNEKNNKDHGDGDHHSNRQHHDSHASSHGESTPRRRRSLYRQGSLSSQLAHEEFGIPMTDVNGAPRSSIEGGRSRRSSGKSIRSRIASRSEYHQDLHEELQSGLNFNLLLLAFIIVFGSSFLFGYNIGVLNQPSTLIKDFYNETYTARGKETTETGILFLWSLTTALFLPGGMIGSFSAAWFADKFGRKKAIMISHIPAFIGAIISTCCLAAKAPELLMLGRFVTGLNCGMASQLAPMFLTEISPFNMRGAFGTANQLFVTIGIFMGSVFGIRELLGTPGGWPYLLLLNAIPAFVSLVAFPFLPESPRYLLLKRNDRPEAEKALRWLRKRTDVMVDIEEMETECNKAEGEEKEEEYTFIKVIKTKALWLPLIVACVLQVAQQFSGVNGIFFYSTSIFEGAGVKKDYIQYAVIGTNAINVLMTIIAVPIMDKAGRRPLLLYPMIVMVFVLALITAALNLQTKLEWMSYISILCVFLYVICFAIGLGPIPWMIGAELFRQGPRPIAMSLAAFTNWFCTMIIAICFELIQAQIKEFTFVIFMVLMIIFSVFVFFLVPETKNKTFEEIASQFQPGDKIEVEEIIDDVFEYNQDEEPDETGRLMSDRKERSRSTSKSSSADDVRIKMSKDPEKMSLTKSEENVCAHPV